LFVKFVKSKPTANGSIEFVKFEFDKFREIKLSVRNQESIK